MRSPSAMAPLAQAKATLISCCLNEASAALNLGEWAAARDRCTAALAMRDHACLPRGRMNLRAGVAVLRQVHGCPHEGRQLRQGTVQAPTVVVVPFKLRGALERCHVAKGALFRRQCAPGPSVRGLSPSSGLA